MKTCKMMKLFTILLLLITTFSYSQVQVRGYYRKDGTYVRPHVRTSPNSTVTDNYSYPGNYNPNLEYNPPLPKSTITDNYNSYTNTDKEWVNGYYRKDGTYVNGYYRQKRSTSNSNSNNSSTNYSVNNDSEYGNYSNSSKKFVNTTKVNFRTSPEISDNIIGELNYLDEVIFISTFGYWDKVKVKRYNPETSKYFIFEGYINSRYLSNNMSPQPEYYTAKTTRSPSNIESKNFKVISNRAYFYATPNVKDRKKAYLIFGEVVYAIAESKYFVYIEFVNSSGVQTIGWILKDDLVRD